MATPGCRGFAARAQADCWKRSLRPAWGPGEVQAPAPGCLQNQEWLLLQRWPVVQGSQLVLAWLLVPGSFQSDERLLLVRLLLPEP